MFLIFSMNINGGTVRSVYDVQYYRNMHRNARYLHEHVLHYLDANFNNVSIISYSYNPKTINRTFIMSKNNGKVH